MRHIYIYMVQNAEYFILKVSRASCSEHYGTSGRTGRLLSLLFLLLWSAAKINVSLDVFF